MMIGPDNMLIPSLSLNHRVASRPRAPGGGAGPPVDSDRRRPTCMFSGTLTLNLTRLPVARAGQPEAQAAQMSTATVGVGRGGPTAQSR